MSFPDSSFRPDMLSSYLAVTLLEDTLDSGVYSAHWWLEAWKIIIILNDKSSPVTHLGCLEPNFSWVAGCLNVPRVRSSRCTQHSTFIDEFVFRPHPLLFGSIFLYSPVDCWGSGCYCCISAILCFSDHVMKPCYLLVWRPALMERYCWRVIQTWYSDMCIGSWGSVFQWNFSSHFFCCWSAYNTSWLCVSSISACRVPHYAILLNYMLLPSSSHQCVFICRREITIKTAFALGSSQNKGSL